MTANERRAEIMRILVVRRSENLRTLAKQLGACRRTICTDIEILTSNYPLKTIRGKGGCVCVADWYHPHRNILSLEQQNILLQLMEYADTHQRMVLQELLLEYGSPNKRQHLKL